MQETKVVKVDVLLPEAEKIKEAEEVIRAGGLVAFPTETVYGLGADPFVSAAVEKLFWAKGRSSHNPLTLHIADPYDLVRFSADLPEAAKRLAEIFWPGPLTLIVWRGQGISDAVTGGQKTIGVRMPDHPVALALIRACGPLVAPSANLSGKISPTKAEHVVQDLAGRIDLILDGGKTGIGVESTVLDLTTEIPCILRPGFVTLESLQQVLGEVILAEGASQKARHYTPNAELILVCGQKRESIQQKLEELAQRATEQGKKTAVLVSKQNEADYSAAVVKVLGTNATEIAHNLFAVLREMDEQAVDLILLEGISNTGLGLTIRNRMEKAAGYHVVEV